MDEERLRFEIATKVMGLEVFQVTDVGYEPLKDFTNFTILGELFYDDGSIHWQPLPEYSGNMSDCWQAVEQLNQPHFTSIDRNRFSEWFEKVHLWTLPEREAATMICKAILTLYGLQEDKEVDDYAIEEYN